ncbi:hypothetical protein Tco_0812633 [Tanacetum coccineum]
MDDPNMAMEEYIKLEEEKASRHGRVFNWQTTTYGKIRDALQCKSQVSTPVNDDIDFRISFEEYDDEDYTIIYDKNLFSYKMISVNNLKTDSENGNEKARVPSFLPPKLTTSYIDDLDFFNDLENEFLTIIYNDAQTSKSDLLTEPILSPQHIDEFNLNDETSVFEYDEEEQNILYYNDIFPFNITRIVDLKSDENNNDNDIDIIQSSKGNEITHRSNVLMDTSSDKIDKIFNEESFVLELNAMGSLHHVDQRHHFLGMRDCSTTKADILSILSEIDSRIYRRDRLCHRLIACSIASRSQPPEKLTVTDLFYLRGMDVDSVNVPYFLARYLTFFVVGRKIEAHISGLGSHGTSKEPNATTGALVVAEDVPTVDEGDQRMARLEEDVHEIHGALIEQREVIDAMARDFSRFSKWVVIGLGRMMDRAGVTYVPYS